MADGGNSNAFPGILKGVNGGLNLFYQCGGRNREGAVDHHQLHSSAHSEHIVLGGGINGIKPKFHRFGNPGKALNPRFSFLGRDHVGRFQIPIPSPVNLHPTNAGNGIDLFNIVNLVSAEGLGIQAVKVSLSEKFGIFFIFTGNQHRSDFTGFKAIHIFNGDHRSGVVIASFTSRFTGQFIVAASPIRRNIIVQFPNGKAGVQRQEQSSGVIAICKMAGLAGCGERPRSAALKIK